MLARHAPETGEGDRGGQVAQADVGVTVAFTCEGQDGVGAGVDSAGDAAGEVHSEERKAGIGHGVDQGAHQGGALGHEVIVFAAERDDHYVRGVTGHAGDAVAEQAGAVDERAGGKWSAWGLDHDFVGRAADVGGSGGSENGAAAGGYQFCIFLAYDGVVGDAGRGDHQGLQTDGVGLDLAQFFGADEAEAGQAVGFAALAEVFEAREFVGVGGDDDFATDLVGDGVFAAELDHGRGARHAEAGFQRAGLVVDAGVDDAAVVSALVAGDAVSLSRTRRRRWGKRRVISRATARPTTPPPMMITLLRESVIELRPE